MTDSLRSVTDRGRIAAQRAEEAEAARSHGWWADMPAEGRAALLSGVFLAFGVLNLVVGAATLVGVTVSVAAGVATGGIVFGLTLFVIGVLFGLNNG